MRDLTTEDICDIRGQYVYEYLAGYASTEASCVSTFHNV